MRISLSVVRLLAAGILLAGASHAKASVYSFIDLGVISNGIDSFAYGINNAEQTTGAVFTSMKNGSTGVRWDGALPSILGTLGGSNYAQGNAINSAGQVVGWSTTASHQNHATLWNGTTPTILGTLPGGADSEALAINSSGVVVGWSENNKGDDRATLWNQNGAQDLGTIQPGGRESTATGINDAGQIAGYSDITTADGKTTHATKWINGQAVDLGTLEGGSSSYAYAINNVGQVAGYSYTADYTAHATLWNGTTAIDLGTLGGTDSSAYGINNVGQVVGWAQNENYETRATLWNGTTATDLNSYLAPSAVEAGWYLYEARGINDRGSIVGLAFNFASGTHNAFLLSTVSPVPEPETYVMLLIGLGVVAFMIRRKRGTTPFSPGIATLA